MPEEATILFLYSRLPDYFYQCIAFFVDRYTFKAVIIRYKGDINTKYSFPPNDRIRLYYKDEVNLSENISQVNPSAIVISGWSDKQYTSIAKNYRNKIPVVLAIDNPWYGTMKQRILSQISSFTIRKMFNKVWITGLSQYEYASRLGFSRGDIIQNLYSADCEKFYAHSGVTSGPKNAFYPHTIVYVGRMVEYKQPHLLAEVFSEVINSMQSDWKLILAGEGPLKELIRKRNYKQVEVWDFIDPADLPGFYMSAGVFCLPSIGEHWGVAVHEAAAAGLPLLLSDSVEAGTQFLIHGFNGYKFRTGNRESLKKYLSQLMGQSDQQQREMANNSIMLSRSISHKTWAANLNSILAG